MSDLLIEFFRGNFMPRMSLQQLRDYQVRMAGARREDKSAPSKKMCFVEDESDLQDRIIAYCRSKMWFVVYSGMHRRTSTPIGTPDFVIYADGGRVFTIETKSKTGKQTPEQLGVQLMLEKLGHKYHLIKSFEAFIEIVSK